MPTGVRDSSTSGTCLTLTTGFCDGISSLALAESDPGTRRTDSGRTRVPGRDGRHATACYLDLMAKVLTRFGFEGRNTTVVVPAGSDERYLWESSRQRCRTAGEPGRARRVPGRPARGGPRLAGGRREHDRTEADGQYPPLRRDRRCRRRAGRPRRDRRVAWAVPPSTCAPSSRPTASPTAASGWPTRSRGSRPRPGSRPTRVTSSTPSASWRCPETRSRRTSADTTCSTTRCASSRAGSATPCRRPRSERLAVLRLDGDMYDSTMDALEALYEKVSPGGFVIVDDYGAVPACAEAVHDFRASRG